jgi:hypothetical protein
MKKFYEAPEMSIVLLNSAEIIVTSGSGECGGVVTEDEWDS